MMLKSQNANRPLLTAAARLPFGKTCGFVVGCASVLMIASGCRQAGAPTGTAGMAPISGMPGQAPMTGPTLPALGPFGASARVPPPATGSYGNPNGQALGGTNAMPANYAPPNIAPMAYNDSAGGNNVAAAGGFAAPPNNAAAANAAGSPWQETSAYPTAPYNPNMDLSRDPVSSVRSGGMPINDLTGAPPPPGYSAPVGYTPPAGATNVQAAPAPGYMPQPSYPQQQANSSPQPGQYPATSLVPLPSTDTGGWAPLNPSPPAPPMNPATPSAPTSGGGYVDASPAANQPSMSTANRPVQWQAPR
ncbi:hypothetical protein [Allorhodopirellula heiligendammensis]|uniref:Uncharacterized protein n=1 Tax=Allorhodopirellula heiligendammensis TaxID=2714739 RepID=A0A5C6BWN1_9BACT|nr:hypothetical protein [Allorhodopirellula heiligendammensis]TWU16378.1 hypothetical protein Poly21_35830 [Allorhodopirellula heiligendammensis]